MYFIYRNTQTYIVMCEELFFPVVFIMSSVPDTECVYRLTSENSTTVSILLHGIYS